jgi:hypothetical protein
MFDEDDVIFSYSRAQAIEDGVLIDVTSTAQEMGIRYPVAVTAALYNSIIEPDDKAVAMGETAEGRLWDMLWMFRQIASRSLGSEIQFSFNASFNGKLKLIKLKAVCGPGDDLEPVITIMLPDED